MEFLIKTLNIHVKKVYKWHIDFIHKNSRGFTMNIPLFSAIFSIASTVLIGILMIVVFVNDMTNMQTVLGAVVAGLVVSIPIALVVTKRISTMTNSASLTPDQQKIQ